MSRRTQRVFSGSGTNLYDDNIIVNTCCPAWCGLVDSVSDCEPKGLQFISQSGHMPGLWARSPVGMCERQPHIEVSLPLSLPSPL